MFSREIRAEYVPPRIRRFWKRQPKLDPGEFPRHRLGERRTLVMAARDAPPPTTVLDASENLLRAAERFERVNEGWNEDLDGRR